MPGERRPSILAWLTGEVDNAQLILFRQLFGVLLFLEAAGAILLGWVRRTFVEPRFTFKIPGFEWLDPLPGTGMYAVYAVMAAAAVGVAVGWRFRVSLGVFCVLWTWSYLTQTASYNNHYYLIILVSILLLLTPAHCDRSLDVRRGRVTRSTRCPRWCTLIFVIQITVVYVYAAVAKLYPDWLAVRPVRIWLEARSDWRVVGDLFTERWFQFAIAYGGILFDFLIVPGLLWRPTRLPVFVVSIVFHLFNSFVFRIGVFPYFALGFSVFFFPPETIRRVFRRPAPVGRSTGDARCGGVREAWALPVLGAWFVIQIVLPLRHFAYPGESNWTEEGHRMAWHMMLRTKVGTAVFRVVDRTSRRAEVVQIGDWLSEKQASRLATRPDMIWQFAQRLAAAYRERWGGDVEVYADTRVSLNGRPPQPIVGLEVDLAHTEWNLWGPNDWIVPLREE